MIKMTAKLGLFATLLFLTMLQGCSSNAFHLRKNIELAPNYQRVQLENLSDDDGFKDAFELALEDAGGRLSEKANTVISFINFREGRRAVAYNKDRKARVYLLFLKFEYDIAINNKKLEKRRITLDKTFVYDADFALGKAEEESQIKEDLYAEAARLILLRLQYSDR